MEISSAQNALFKQFLSLHESRGIRQHAQFILAGQKIVNEVVKQYPQLISHVVVESDVILPSPLNTFPVARLSKTLFQMLDILGTHSPLLICQLPEIFPWRWDQTECGLEVLLTLGDPGNLGAAVRSCVAFGATRIVLLKECAHPFHPKAVRASAGACLKSQFVSGPSLAELASHSFTNLILLDMDGTRLDGFTWPENCRLLVGEEGPGLGSFTESPGLANKPPQSGKLERIHIPMASGVESLNAMVALSIALYSRARQFHKRS